MEEARIKLCGNALNWEYSVARNQILSGQLYVMLISIALLVISLTIAEIRADPISGICFISSESLATRICLSVLPLSLFLVIKSVIIYLVIKHFRTIQRHLTIYTSCQQEIHSKRISRTTRFYVFILLFLWTFWSFSIYTHWYIFTNEGVWYKALINHFLCKLRHTLLLSSSTFSNEHEMSTCIPETKPIINVFILHNFSYFSINAIYIICVMFNKQSLLIWKKQLLKCVSAGDKQETPIDGNNETRNIYLGLQNRSLLDALWNPGVFAYLVGKKKKKDKEENWRSRIEEKSATIGSVEDSSASYCVYHQDGSLRSCVSMPPIKSVSRQNICRCSQDLSKHSPTCTTLDDFIKVTQSFVGENSVRRSNSFAGRPCIGTSHIPYTDYHSGSRHQFNPVVNNLTTHHDHAQHRCNYNSCSLSSNHHINCSSLNRIPGLPQHTPSYVDMKARKKPYRRFSLLLDRRYENGVSSRSTLNHRKPATRWSVTPKSLTQTINRQSSSVPPSQHADPASCHSSNFSAESYNSFNLMAQQMGGRWRDICRTRMTLHDAMMWAQTASHPPCHNPMCSKATLCKPQQHCIARSVSGQNYHCTPNFNPVSSNHIDPSVLIHDTNVIDCYDTHTIGHLVSSSEQIPLAKPAYMKGSKTSIASNNCSDQFNSEDEIVSTGNSEKSTDKESGEFCSDDEVVSLINSDN